MTINLVKAAYQRLTSAGLDWLYTQLNMFQFGFQIFTVKLCGRSFDSEIYAGAWHWVTVEINTALIDRGREVISSGCLFVN
jgi:hypothetical protein